MASDLHAITQDIRDAIRRTPELATHDVTVRVADGKALLQGKVDSRYRKQQAESVAAGVPDVIDIQNDVDIPAGGTAKSDREIKDDKETS